MEKFKQIKIKQHYVWEYYLKSWAIDSKVFWLTPKGKVACDSSKAMCRENDFYKISLFDAEDLEYISRWSRQSPVATQRLHAQLVQPFIDVTNQIGKVRRLRLDDEDVAQCEVAMLNNSLENMYCSIESGAKLAVDGLANGDISVLGNRNVSVGLYSYLGHQITRTKAFKERFFGQAKKNISPSDVNNEAMRLAEKNWWFLCYMMGENIGSSLYCSRHEDNLFLVENKSNISFITSDSPVINVHPDNDAKLVGVAPTSLDLMFPVSPKYVLMITNSLKWNYLSLGADGEDVEELNSRVAVGAYCSIYGDCESVVKSNIPFFVSKRKLKSF